MFRKVFRIGFGAAAALLITTPIALAQPRPVLEVGNVIVRRAPTGDVLDSIVVRNGADVDFVRTRVSANGTIISRERRLRRAESVGIVERSASSEFLLLPHAVPRLNEKYPCGYVGVVVLVCTMLEPEIISTPLGRIAARHVLMATLSADAAFTELWTDSEYGIVRARGRSNAADEDFDLYELRRAGTPNLLPQPEAPARKLAQAADPAPEASAISPRSASPHRGLILQVGGGFATRQTRIPAFDFNGHDSGVSGTVAIGAFVGPHVALLLAADGFRDQSAGDMIDGAFVQYPSPRFEQLIVAGPSLMFSTGASSGFFARIGGGLALADARFYTVGKQRVISGWNYGGSSLGYSLAIGNLMATEHFAITPYLSALAIPAIDVWQLGTDALAFPAAKHLVISAGLSFGTK